jgi:thiamine-monophosphate kinase
MVPLSAALIALHGYGRASRLAAASAGDDYELLFAAPSESATEILALSEELGLSLSKIGAFTDGDGLALFERGEAVPLPSRLGFEHRR